MTTSLLRPNATIIAPSSVTGAASSHAATSDDSDSSYATVGLSSGVVGMGTVSIGGGVTKSICLWAHARAVTGTSAISVSAATSAATGGVKVAQLVNIPVNTTFATKLTAALPVTLTQTEIDALEIAYRAVGGGDCRFAEFVLELRWVAKPTVAIDAVTPDPYTTSSQITLSWTPTLDSEGGPQTRYQLKLYRADDYPSFSGVDPDVTPTRPEDQVTKSSSDTSRVLLPRPNGTYRAYLRVAQTVNGELLWSDWDYDEYEINVAVPEIDAVTVTPDDVNARNVITIERDSSSEAWDKVTVERSDDGGATWVPVRGATWLVPDDANEIDVSDDEAPADVPVIYRAQAVHYDTGLPFIGSWFESSLSPSWHADLFWLKVPGEPALKLAVDARTLPAPVRALPQGVFKAPGAKYPIVITGARQATTGTIQFQPQSDAAAELLLELLEQPVLMLQAPEKLHRFGARWIVPGDVTEEWVTSTYIQPLEEYGWFTVPYTEVDAPPDLDSGVL